MTQKKSAAVQIRAARDRADDRERIEPRADRVTYDEKRGLIFLDLRGGAILGLPVFAIRELREVQSEDLKSVRAGFGGESISLERLDIDISIPGLLRDLVR